MNEKAPKPSPQEIVVVHRSDPKPKGRWDDLEQVAKIVALIAIPIVVAILGWKVQDSLSKRNVSQAYVALAVSVLKESDLDVDPALRSWAVDLLNENSQIKLAPPSPGN